MGFLLSDVQYAAANRDATTQNLGVMTPAVYDSYFSNLNATIAVIKARSGNLWGAYTKDNAPIKILNEDLRYWIGNTNALRYEHTSADYVDRYISGSQPSYVALYMLCKRIELIENYTDNTGHSFNYWGTPQTDCPSALFCAGDASQNLKPDYTLFNDIERRLNGIYIQRYRSGTPGGVIPLWYYWTGTSYPVMDVLYPESGWLIPTYA